MKVGDLIKCRDKEDMVDIMYDLASEGIDTDYVYEHNGEKGFWLKVTEVENE